MTTAPSGGAALAPILVSATGLSLASEWVTVSPLRDGTVGVSVRAYYGTATAWLTESEARDLAAALLTQVAKGDVAAGGAR